MSSFCNITYPFHASKGSGVINHAWPYPALKTMKSVLLCPFYQQHLLIDTNTQAVITAEGQMSSVRLSEGYEQFMKSVSSHRGLPCFYITCLRHFYRLFTFNTMHTDFALSGSHGSIWIVGCYWCFVLSCTDRAAYGIGASRFAQHAQKNGCVFAGADRHWCWEETCKGITVQKISVNTMYFICLDLRVMLHKLCFCHRKSFH